MDGALAVRESWHCAVATTCFDRLSMRVFGAAIAPGTLILNLSKGEAGDASTQAAG